LCQAGANAVPLRRVWCRSSKAQQAAFWAQPIPQEEEEEALIFTGLHQHLQCPCALSLSLLLPASLSQELSAGVTFHAISGSTRLKLQ
jgi:hypothetical protein